MRSSVDINGAHQPAHYLRDTFQTVQVVSLYVANCGTFQARRFRLRSACNGCTQDLLRLRKIQCVGLLC